MWIRNGCLPLPADSTSLGPVVVEETSGSTVAEAQEGAMSETRRDT